MLQPPPVRNRKSEDVKAASPPQDGLAVASLIRQEGCQPAPYVFSRPAACWPSQPSWLTSDSATVQPDKSAG